MSYIPSFFLFQYRALQYMFLINGAKAYSQKQMALLELKIEKKAFTVHGQCTVDHKVVQSVCLFSLLFIVRIEHNTCMKVSISSMRNDGT